MMVMTMMMTMMMMIVTLDGNKGNDDDDDDESIAETGRQLSPGYNYPCLGSHAIAAGVRDDHDEDDEDDHDDGEDGRDDYVDCHDHGVVGCSSHSNIVAQMTPLNLCGVFSVHSTQPIKIRVDQSSACSMLKWAQCSLEQSNSAQQSLPEQSNKPV